jgi:hypothetical protein
MNMKKLLNAIGPYGTFTLMHFENVLLARLFQIEYLARPRGCVG